MIPLMLTKKQRWIVTLVITSLLVGPTEAQFGRAPPPPEYGIGPPRIDLKMAIVMVLLVIVFFILGFLAVYTRQCAQERFLAQLELGFEFGPGTETHNRGLDRDVIESLPAFLYSAVKGLKIGKGSLECAVCLSEFEDSETLRLIPKCDHVFHRDCIDAWLVSQSTCPVCRANLIPKPGEPTLANFLVPVQPEPEPEPELEPSRSEPARPPRSWSTGIRLGWSGPSGQGIIPRSRSVGHFPLGPGESLERFTLRLPGEVRSQLMGAPVASLPRVGSTRRGFRTGSVRRKDGSVYERFDPDVTVPDSRWVFSVVPPFVSRSGSTSSGPSGSSSDGNHDRERSTDDHLRQSDQC